MNNLKLVRVLGLATLVASAPALLAVVAHAQSPSPAPAAGQTKTIPPVDMDADMPKAGSNAGTLPASPDSTVTAPPAGAAAGNSAATEVPGIKPGIKDVTVGTAVFGSDGQKIGEVKGVKAQPGGAVEEIHVKTGGILGFGGKVVVIPGAKIAKGGQTIQISLTSDEVGKLPELAENKG